MSLLSMIIIFTLLGGVLSVLAASLYLIIPGHWQQRVLPHLVSFAIGTLLGAAFLALLPHALIGHKGDSHEIFMAVLGGLFMFFILEKMVLWRHCHSHDCDVHQEPHGHHTTGSLILIGDGLHNFVDGVLIGAAFLTDEHLGIVTAMAVAAHEIPQELGDFAVLLHSGYSRLKAFILNVATSLTTVAGGILAYYSLSDLDQIIPYVLAVSASSFIYIAVADLIPGLHQKAQLKETVQQVILIALGVTIIFFAHEAIH
jgi:zinc and cadmium transporter